jgi:HEAT repeat protein
MPKAGAALTRITRFETESNFAGLLNSLEHDSEDVRLAAVWALGRLGERRAIPYVNERLSDSDAIVRQTACEVLGVLRAKASETNLLHALDDPDRIVRSAAADALGRVGEASTVERVRAALHRVAHDDFDMHVRLTAAEALIALRDDRISSVLPAVIQGVPWKSRRSTRVRRLKEAARSGQPLPVEPHLWQLVGPRRLKRPKQHA